MARNPNIAVITIGYNKYAFEDTQTALELMAILSKAVQVNEETWSLREHTNHTFFLIDDSSMPELKYAPANKFNTQETVQEVKDRVAREAKDRADMEAGVREVPTPLDLPAPATVDSLDDHPF